MLVATDRSDTATRAVAWAAEISGKYGADLVVLQVIPPEHLTGQDEIYGGENRGNPEAFARMAIDAGADLIIGYSPHVLRAMEIYHHRLIAYSLGNFAGYHNFTLGGDLGISGILQAKLAADGRFQSGRFVSTTLTGPGQPEFDPGGHGAALIEQLSREDLGARGAHVSSDGRITP